MAVCATCLGRIPPGAQHVCPPAYQDIQISQVRGRGIVVDTAPRHARIALTVLRRDGTGTGISIGDPDLITIADQVVYRITGWDPLRACLTLELVEDWRDTPTTTAEPLPEQHCCNWKAHDPHPWLPLLMNDAHQCPGWPLPPDRIANALAAAALTPESTAAYEAFKEQWQRKHDGGKANHGKIMEAAPEPDIRTIGEEAKRQMDADPHGIKAGEIVAPYTERGESRWLFRCWGSDTCAGWLGLGHHSEQGAQRERDRHRTEAHPDEPPRSAG